MESSDGNYDGEKVVVVVEVVVIRRVMRKLSWRFMDAVDTARLQQVHAEGCRYLEA